MALPDMVGYVTKDMAATLAFYGLLGLEIPAGSESEGHVEIVTPNGYRMAWDTEEMVRSFMPDLPDLQGGNGRIGVAFKCESPTEVDALYRAVLAAGHHG